MIFLRITVLSFNHNEKKKKRTKDTDEKRQKAAGTQ